MGADGGVLADNRALSHGGAFEQGRAPAHRGPVADQGAGQSRPVADIHPIQQDAAPHLGVVADVAAIPQDGEGAYLGRRADLDVFTDIDGRDEGVAARRLFGHADAVLDGQVGFHPALQNIPLASQIRGQIPDVAPIILGFIGVQGQAVPQEQGKQILGEVEIGIRRDGFQRLGGQDIDPGIGRVGGRLAPAGLFQEAGDPPLPVKLGQSVFPGIGHPGDDQGGGGVTAFMKRAGFTQVDVGQGVAADDQNIVIGAAPLAVHRQADAARRAQGLVLLGERQAHLPVAVPEMGGDGRRDIPHRHRRVQDVVLLEQVEDVFQHRPAAQVRHGLGAVAGEGTQARAFPARHNDCFHE